METTNNKETISTKNKTLIQRLKSWVVLRYENFGHSIHREVHEVSLAIMRMEDEGGVHPKVIKPAELVIRPTDHMTGPCNKRSRRSRMNGVTAAFALVVAFGLGKAYANTADTPIDQVPRWDSDIEQNNWASDNLTNNESNEIQVIAVWSDAAEPDFAPRTQRVKLLHEYLSNRGDYFNFVTSL